MRRGSRASGPERRGAPVTAFNRVDDKQIKIRSGIYHPDVVVVLDESLVALVDVAEGLKPEGILLVNTTKTLAELKKDIHFEGKIATCRRNGDRLEGAGRAHHQHDHAGRPGQADRHVKFESLDEPIKERFGRIAAKNMAAAKSAYDQVKIIN